MWSRSVGVLFAVAVYGVVSPAVVRAQVDVNTPWDPNTHLAAYPEGMAQARHFDYSADPELPWTPSSRVTLELSGAVDVIDPNGLIGLGPDIMGVQVQDELGQPVYVHSDHDWSRGISYWPVTYTSTMWVDMDGTTEKIWSIVPYEFNVKMVLGAENDYPLMLSRVQWSMHALLSDAITVVDLPFAASEDWVELAPGLDILIEQVSVAENQYEHRSSIVFDPNRIAYPRKASFHYDSDEGLAGYIWPSEGSPETIVMEIDVLNADGLSIQNHGGDGRVLGISRGGDYDEGRMTQAITSNGSARDAAAFIRYVIATDPYQQQVRLVLEDVPVPGL